MSGDDLVDFYVHTITVQTLTGTGAYGDVYAAPVSEPSAPWTDHAFPDRMAAPPRDGKPLTIARSSQNCAGWSRHLRASSARSSC